MDMNLSKLQEIVRGRWAWSAAVREVAKCRIWLSNWTTATIVTWRNQALSTFCSVILNYIYLTPYSSPHSRQEGSYLKGSLEEFHSYLVGQKWVWCSDLIARKTQKFSLLHSQSLWWWNVIESWVWIRSECTNFWKQKMYIAFFPCSIFRNI